jgi:hypothetical protein
LRFSFRSTRGICFSKRAVFSTLGSMHPEPTTAAAAAEAEVSVVDGSAPAAPVRERRRRRWRKWVVLALIILVIRLSVSAVVAPLLAARLSRALGTRVDIGDVSVQPIDAILTLRNVTVHPPAGSTVVETTPPIVARRVRVDVQWLPLLHQQLQIRELVLESARVDLYRLADGSFGLARLERANPATQLPGGWSMGLNRIVARNSQLRVRDLAADGPGMLEATLRTASVSGIRQRATAFGRAPNLHVDALVGGGQLRVRGRYQLRDDGLVLDTQMRVKDLPLAQAKPYVADRGWTDLSGTVSGRLRWQREPRRRDLLSGRVVLRRGRIQVGGLAEPALAIRRGIADIGAIDLLSRRVAVQSLTLRGATLAVQPDGDALIPLLATTGVPPPPMARHEPSRASSDRPTRWHWTIERFETADGRVRILSPDGHLDLRAQASGENLGPGAYWSPVRIHARRREAVAEFDGTVRLGDGAIIEGRLTAGGVDVPSLARAAALPWADLVQAGRATVDLTVQLDTVRADTFTRGGISLTDVWVAGPDPGMFAFGSPAIDLTLDRYESPAAPRRDGRPGRPALLTFSAAQINAPYLLVTRTADGWTLPPFTLPPEETAAIDTAAVPLLPEPTSEVVEITLRALRISEGSVIVVDLVPTSPLTWDITHVAGSVDRLSLPAFSFDGMRVRGSEYHFGSLQLGGSRSGGSTTFEAAGDDVPLAAVAPYLRLAGLPYSFASGTAAFTARGLITDTHWSAEAALTLQDASLIGAEALQLSIGMPVSSALAVLRDESGATSLQLALASARAGGQGTLADQVAAGILSTIHGVTEAAAIAAREQRSLPAVDVQFSPGQVQLTPSAMQDIAPLGELVGSRPGLMLELSAATSQKDRRWLAEQALLPSLEDSGGFMGVLRALGMQDSHARIRTALAARTRGAPGFLDAADDAALTRLLAEAPPVAGHRLDALREVRLTRVLNHLREHYGITGAGVVVRRAALDREDLAVVRVQVGIRPEAPAAAIASEVQ